MYLQDIFQLKNMVIMRKCVMHGYARSCIARWCKTIFKIFFEKIRFSKALILKGWRSCTVLHFQLYQVLHVMHGLAATCSARPNILNLLHLRSCILGVMQNALMQDPKLLKSLTLHSCTKSPPKGGEKNGARPPFFSPLGNLWG